MVALLPDPSARPQLRLTFDINQTVMIGDGILGHTPRDCILEDLRRLERRGELQGRDVEEELEKMLAKLRLPSGDFCILLPGFLRLIRDLHEAKRDFSVAFSTFGSDLPNVAQDWNRFCEGRHPLHEGFLMPSRRLDLDDADSCGYLLRQGSESDDEIFLIQGRIDLAPGSCSSGWGQTTPEDFLKWYETGQPADRVLRGAAAVRDFFDSAAREGRTVAVRNCYPHWAANGRKASAGKVHFVHQGPSASSHALFIDDLAGTGEGGRGIVDCRCLTNPEERLDIRETLGVHVVATKPLDAVRDIGYLSTLVADAEEAFANRMGSTDSRNSPCSQITSDGLPPPGIQKVAGSASPIPSNRRFRFAAWAWLLRGCLCLS
mmetsp:Transcript_23638/g.52413  ORF Transcript_23638/g.52413 Transcript_23638/m.52413 type:complete len:376 (-) Transcript_23638:281-1408(-)